MTNHPRELWRLIRAPQWVKNLMVFTGALFGHAWTDLSILTQVTAAAAGFSFVASSVYILNDFADRAADRHHPVKRRRPLAAGTVTPGAALLLAAVLLVTGLGMSYYASAMVLAIVAGYLVINLAYSFHLKHVVILDVFLIAAGFMLRILAGTTGVGIPPSHWLLLCGLMVTLFLGFTKRRAEMMVLESGHGSHRKVLEHYSPVLLDKMIGITAACAIITYSLYTADEHTIQLHGTDALVYTVPFVMYAIFRYIYLLHHKARGGDPSSDLLRDPHVLWSVSGWLALTLWLIR
jgi:4-hydroxybenzoate polyprenyltransferase